ncbi:hypothetical protein FALCPG4_014979 [Fusarium falciforme]
MGGNSEAAPRRAARRGPRKRQRKLRKMCEQPQATLERQRMLAQSKWQQVATSAAVRSEGPQATESAGSGNGSRTQMVLRTMPEETSSHLMSERKQMLERLWDALLENQKKATKVMSDQLEMIRQLQQEIRTISAEAAEDRKKAEETRHA